MEKTEGAIRKGKEGGMRERQEGGINRRGKREGLNG